MKSRTSCFDPATARMALRRFAPVPILYTLGMLLFLLMAVFSGSAGAYSRAMDMLELTRFTSVIQFVYAFVLCELLFGDLYTPKLCYTIHALPISRGAFFGTQVVLGLACSLLPNALLTLILLPALRTVEITALYWLAAATLQFLCFFGIGCLSAICAGNRIGLMLIDGIISFLAVLVYWFAAELFIPMLYGLDSNPLDILLYCPVYAAANAQYYEIEYLGACTADRVLPEMESSLIHLGTGWWMVAAYAMLGIVCLWLAMRLYRRRQLECAGDLVAFGWLQPVFLVLYTVTVGGFFHLFAFVMDESSMTRLFLLIGIVVGYYTGLMLIRRQVQVFTKGAFLRVAAIALVTLAAMACTGLDILGLTRKLPEAGQIEKAYISTYSRLPSADCETSPENALDIHRRILADHTVREQQRSLLRKILDDAERTNSAVYVDGEWHESSTFVFTYQMKDGSQFQRVYVQCDVDSVFPDLKMHFSRPEPALGFTAEDWQVIAEETAVMAMRCEHPREDSHYALEEWKTYDYIDSAPLVTISQPEHIRAIMMAMLEECRNGNMAQDWIFSEEGGYDYLQLSFTPEPGRYSRDLPVIHTESGLVTLSFRINSSCTQVRELLREFGYHP